MASFLSKKITNLLNKLEYTTTKQAPVIIIAQNKTNSNIIILILKTLYTLTLIHTNHKTIALYSLLINHFYNKTGFQLQAEGKISFKKYYQSTQQHSLFQLKGYSIKYETVRRTKLYQNLKA